MSRFDYFLGSFKLRLFKSGIILELRWE